MTNHVQELKTWSDPKSKPYVFVDLDLPLTLAFVTYSDIRSIQSFCHHQVIAIKAPVETLLEVPDPDEVRLAWWTDYMAIAGQCLLSAMQLLYR